MKINTSLLFLSLLILSCKVASPQQDIDNRITAAIGTGYTIKKNKSNTFALCTKSEAQSLSMYIVRLADVKTIVQEVVPRGAAVWEGDLKIKVTTQPGIIKKDHNPDDYVRIIDLNKYILTDH